MSGETELRPSGWSVDTLKEHYDRRFLDQDKAVGAALQAAKEAVIKAENASDKRFEAANQVKATFGDQLAEKLSVSEYKTAHQNLIDKIDGLTDRMNRAEGTDQGKDITMGKIYAAIGAVGAILGIIVLLANGIFN